MDSPLQNRHVLTLNRATSALKGFFTAFNTMAFNKSSGSTNESMNENYAAGDPEAWCESPPRSAHTESEPLLTCPFYNETDSFYGTDSLAQTKQNLCILVECADNSIDNTVHPEGTSNSGLGSDLRKARHEKELRPSENKTSSVTGIRKNRDHTDTRSTQNCKTGHPLTPHPSRFATPVVRHELKALRIDRKAEARKSVAQPRSDQRIRLIGIWLSAAAGLYVAAKSILSQVIHFILVRLGKPHTHNRHNVSRMRLYALRERAPSNGSDSAAAVTSEHSENRLEENQLEENQDPPLDLIQSSSSESSGLASDEMQTLPRRRTQANVPLPPDEDAAAQTLLRVLDKMKSVFTPANADYNHRNEAAQKSAFTSGANFLSSTMLGDSPGTSYRTKKKRDHVGRDEVEFTTARRIDKPKLQKSLQEQFKHLDKFAGNDKDKFKMSADFRRWMQCIRDQLRTIADAEARTNAMDVILPVPEDKRQSTEMEEENPVLYDLPIQIRQLPFRRLPLPEHMVPPLEDYPDAPHELCAACHMADCARAADLDQVLYTCLQITLQGPALRLFLNCTEDETLKFRARAGMKALLSTYSTKLSGGSMRVELRNRAFKCNFHSYASPKALLAEYMKNVKEAREAGLTINESEVIETVKDAIMKVHAYDWVSQSLRVGQWTIEHIGEYCENHYLQVIASQQKSHSPSAPSFVKHAAARNRPFRSSTKPRLHSMVDSGSTKPWKTDCGCPGKMRNQHISKCKHFEQFRSLNMNRTAGSYCYGCGQQNVIILDDRTYVS